MTEGTAGDGLQSDGIDAALAGTDGQARYDATVRHAGHRGVAVDPGLNESGLVPR